MHRGRAVTLEPPDGAHAPDAWEAARDAGGWGAYLRYGPFPDAGSFARHVESLAQRQDQPFWAVRPASSGRAEGWLSLCDIYPSDAAIEIGSIWFSPRLQRTRAATEAVVLLMRHAFDELGYRRLVWRCQTVNAASARAAARYGFRPEGVWRAAAVVKGVQRDVAWFSLLSEEWPARRAALEAWLDDENFGAEGRARRALERA